MRTIIEPFRIKSVEPLRHTTPENQGIFPEHRIGGWMIDKKQLEALAKKNAAKQVTQKAVKRRKYDDTLPVESDAGEDFSRNPTTRIELTSLPIWHSRASCKRARSNFKVRT